MDECGLGERGAELCDLPDSLLLEVLSWMSAPQLARLGQTCWRLYRVTQDQLLWKALFYRHFKVPVAVPMRPGASSWRQEFKRLYDESPAVLSQVLNKHKDQVLHVSFSHNGQFFATSSKDGKIMVWSADHPCQLRFQANMTQEFSWRYTQFSQFNKDDTLLLVSGVHYGNMTTSGEIAVFDLQDFEPQCRVVNKPYDVFGTWYDNQHLLSGTLYWTGNLNSISALWLNKASQAVESERESVMMCLYRFQNVNASSIRTIMVADCPLPARTQQHQVCRKCGKLCPVCCLSATAAPTSKAQAGVETLATNISDSTEATNTSDSAEATNTSDSAEATNTSDSAEATNTSDSAEATNTSDSAEATNTSDSAEATNTSDSAEATNISDSAEATNTSDGAEATNTSDSAEATNTSDGAEVTNTNNSAQATNATNKIHASDHKRSEFAGQKAAVAALRSAGQNLGMSDFTGHGEHSIEMTECVLWHRDERDEEREGPCSMDLAYYQGAAHGQGAIRGLATTHSQAATHAQAATHGQGASSADREVCVYCGALQTNSPGSPRPGIVRADSSEDRCSVDVSEVDLARERLGHCPIHSKRPFKFPRIMSGRQKFNEGDSYCVGETYTDLCGCTDGENDSLHLLGSQSRVAEHSGSESDSLQQPGSQSRVTGLSGPTEHTVGHACDTAQDVCMWADRSRAVSSPEVDARTLSCSSRLASGGGSEGELTEKLLIFTLGEETYTPHLIGIKRIKLQDVLGERAPGDLRGSNGQVRLLPNVDENIQGMDRPRDEVDHVINMKGHIVGMALSPDHRYLYVNSRQWPHNYSIERVLEPPPIAQEIDIHVIDLQTLREVGTIMRSHKAFTPNDECFFLFLDISNLYVASGAEDKHGYIWDRHYGVCLSRFPHTDVVNSVAFNRQDEEMLVTVSDDHKIKIWRSRRRLRQLGIPPFKDTS